MRVRLSLTTLGLVAGLGIIASVATYAYRHVSSLEDTERWLSHSYAVLDASHLLATGVGDAGRARRIYVESRDDADLAAYRGAVIRVTGAQQDLRRLVADNAAQRDRLDPIDAVVNARIDQLEAAVAYAHNHAFNADAEAVLTSAAVALTMRLATLLREFDLQERMLLDERTVARQAESASVNGAIALGFSASIVILLLAFGQLYRQVARRRRSERALAEREQYLAATLSSIGDGVIATDASGMVTQMNPVAEELTGWSNAEAVGQPFASVFHIISEPTRAPQQDPVARVLAERIKVGLANHTLLVARDGVERAIADSAAPIFDPAGTLHGVVMVFRDVSVASSVEARFRRLVEAAPDAIVIVDDDGRISIANAQASLLFGYPAGELIGRPIETVIPQRLRDRHAQHRGAYHAAPAVRVMGNGLQLLAQRKDGTMCPVEVSLSPLVTSDGRHVIAAVRDVTRRRELERFRDEYVGYISHDLKNPLSVIVLQARLLARLLDRNGADDEKRAVAVIADSAAFIDKLVRELLEMAYVESEQLELDREPIELAGFLRAMLDHTVAASDRDRVHLEIVQPVSVSAEARRLERVVVNFVQNALKFSPPGSPVVVRIDADGDRAVVSVIDRGPGVAPSDRAFVFDKYKRAAATRKTDGLGLGLYISRKIIEAHGGEIGVGSAPTQGAVFFIRLPRVSAAPRRTGGIAAAVPRGWELRGLKVLLVDDEVHAVAALAALLADDGLEVISATSGEQALRLAAARPPDVAVLDVDMPGMSGLTLLDKLRERHPGLLAIIMSGHMEDHPGIAAARETGTVDYVGKPIDVDVLLRTLARLTGPTRGATPQQTAS